MYRRPEVGLELWPTHSGPSWIFVCFEPELLADLGHTWRVGDLVSSGSVESKLYSFVGNAHSGSLLGTLATTQCLLGKFPDPPSRDAAECLHLQGCLFYSI